METLLSACLAQLQELSPLLKAQSDLDDAQTKAEEACASATAALTKAQSELVTTRDASARAKSENEKTYNASVFAKNQEAEALDQRCYNLQLEHNQIQSEISVAVQFEAQLKASMASLMKSVG